MSTSQKWIRIVVLGLVLLPAFTAAAWAAEGEGMTRDPIPILWWVAPVGAVLALCFAFYFYKSMMTANPGNDTMQKIAGHVRDGAMAYLKQQYKIVTLFFMIVCALLIWMAFGLHAQHKIVPLAFLTGGFFSGLAGFFGMKTATNASSRTAQGASESLNRGLQVAFRSGAVMGLTVVGLGLIDICIWFYFLYQYTGMLLEEITVTMLCFGMGASAQALFARVGGGIYTKAADVGADLVGKVEAGIPEDDPRNPATIADNVGDNVGDVAGMGADLYESYCGSILATAALGVAAAAMLGLSTAASLAFLMAPMILAGVGIVVSILGIFLIRTKEDATMGDLLNALRKGIWISSALVVVAAWFITRQVLPGDFGPDIFWSIVTGLVAGVVIGYATEYYTASEYKPTQRVADNCNTGPATTIISGVAEGMMSTWVPILTVGVGTIVAFTVAGGMEEPALGLYGVGFAAVGMLSTLGITLATDAYGPIADNAGGNAEMSGLDPQVRKRTDALDSLGNTTAATGKGFAIGSAALTALALLAAYVEEVRVGQVREAEAVVMQSKPAKGTWVEIEVNPSATEEAPFGRRYAYVDADEKTHAFMRVRGARTAGLGEGWTPPPAGIDEGVWGLIPVKAATMGEFMTYYDVTLMNPKVLVGMFLGAMLVFAFCAMTMNAVGRAAKAMVEEVRRQFREIPGILEGKAEPDYASCVAISTKGAQREMVIPSTIALVMPVAVGLLLGIPGVMGLLAGGLICGFAVAIFMANAGGAWDNAKKYIEAGHHGGKGSDAHKASVVGDTVGDPFKDTSGPSLNILIKLMSMVSVVFAGVVVKYAPVIAAKLGIG